MIADLAANAIDSNPRRAFASPEAVICLMTFHRPEMLRLTLLSLADQIDAPRFAVIVVENDAARRAGAAVAAEFFSARRLAGVCVVEAAPGNCSAANRAFSEARRRFPEAPYILMIDDDEVASPHWLAAIVAAARAQNVDIVGGPALPRFPKGAPRGALEHPIYWSAYSKSGPVPIIYGSGNFLIRREAWARLANPDFDLRYNFLGGGDADFFARCRRAGLTFYWEQGARVDEIVPAKRLGIRWMLQRGLRIGAVNYSVEMGAAASWLGRLRPALKSAAIVPLAFLRAARLTLAGKSPMVALHPIIIAAGRILAAFGIEPEQYRLSGRSTGS
jgi:glycosyltransferase involved in cell wall biosynthesis